LLFCDKKVQRKIQKEIFSRDRKKFKGNLNRRKNFKNFFHPKNRKSPGKKVLRVFFKEKNILEREQKYFNKQIFRR